MKARKALRYAAIAGLAWSGGAHAADIVPLGAPAAASDAAKVAATFQEGQPTATIRGHLYSLAECLALADRNSPQIAAARARLSFMHGQLDEAHWLPFWQMSADSKFGVTQQVGTGTVYYNEIPQNLRTSSLDFDRLTPFFTFSYNATIPLYTFGKITAGWSAAESQVRVGEWDLEKVRQQVRADTRRAYFGLMLARDAKYLVDEITAEIDKQLARMKEKLDKGDPAIDETDRIRMEMSHDEVAARAAEAKRGETFATASLRFLTGVQTNFDIPDEPLKMPEKTLGPVVQYLTAARLFRPEINMARAGVAARRAQVEYARARFFPDVGLGIQASYAIAPGVQRGSWVGDPFNGFGFGAGLGFHWSLDLWPQAARVHQAEAQLEEVRALERAALGGLAVEVENAHGVALEAKTRAEMWGHAEKRAREWIAMTRDAIDLGTKDERALAEPIRAYVWSRANHLFGLMDYNNALSDLARVSGWDEAAPAGHTPGNGPEVLEGR